MHNIPNFNLVKKTDLHPPRNKDDVDDERIAEDGDKRNEAVERRQEKNN
jgi:hypothetical protein